MARIEQNQKKLNTVDAICRAKFEAVLRDLEKNSFSPLIAEALRTREQQAEKVRKGYSKTMNSYHVPRKGWGGARACDIIEEGKGWNSSRTFWLKLGSSAISHGLNWGGFFGLNTAQKEALIRDIKARKWNTSVKVGWDVAHIEWKG